jgi:hypothetical protein
MKPTAIRLSIWMGDCQVMRVITTRFGRSPQRARRTYRSEPRQAHRNEHDQAPVDGSMTVETLDMRSAGKAPQRACSSRMSSSEAT